MLLDDDESELDDEDRELDDERECELEDDESELVLLLDTLLVLEELLLDSDSLSSPWLEELLDDKLLLLWLELELLDELLEREELGLLTELLLLRE